MSSLNNSLYHDVCHLLVSKYLETKSIVCAFVGSVSLSIYSVRHSIDILVAGIELGTGESMTPSTDMNPVLMKLTFTLLNRNMPLDIHLNMERRWNVRGDSVSQQRHEG